MFALIQTNGATHIAINVPHENSEKTLPALFSMLENNMTFINKGYSEIKTVTPEMSFVLGNKVIEKNYDVELIISESSCVIDENWVTATPQVFLDNSALIKKKDAEISKLRSEITYLTNEIESLKAKLSELAETE